MGHSKRPERSNKPSPPRLRRTTADALAHLTAASADARLSDLTARRAFERPWLGALANAFVRRRGYEQLGFRCLDDWSRERIGHGARAVREWARVSRRLGELPVLREAVLRGEISWTVAGRIVALAGLDNEAECVATARGRTVRAIDTILAALRASEGRDEADEEQESVRLECPGDLRVRWHAAIELARRAAGEDLSLGQVVEVIAAEVASALGAPDVPDEQRPRAEGPGDRAPGLAASRWPWLPSRAARSTEGLPTAEELDRQLAGASAKAIDARMRVLIAQRQRVDFEIGRILARVVDRKLHRELGFASFDEFVRERLDLAPRSARRLVRIARSGSLAIAFRDGRITALQAERLLRGGGTTVADACRVTLRRLDDDTPPPLVVRAPRSVARLFRALVRELGLRKLLDHALATWLEARALVRDYADFERDGWRCTVPGCSARRNLQSHHVRFRSRGGPDESWNRTTLCAFHHLRGVHGTPVRVRIHGRAPARLVYRLGFGSFLSGDLRLAAGG